MNMMNKRALSSSLVLVLCGIVVASASCDLCNLDLGGIIKYYGYPFEIHPLVPPDNTVTLNLYRIPRPNGRPVFLQHGLIDSGITWVENPQNQSLAFMLYNAGYDVWLGNNRGNTYSPCTNDACWSFSFDEMALFDLPTHINYVLSVTGAKTLSYIGHSEGTTQAFAGFSVNPKLGAKVNLMVALAPVAYLNHQRSPLVSLLANLGVAQILNWFGFKDFLANNWIFTDIAKLFCNGGILTGLCESVIFMLCGTDPTKDHNLDPNRLEIYLSHTPSGTSVQNMIHWAQAVKADNFQMYDYGTDGNQKKYGQSTPPLYNLTAYNVPTAFYSGGNDDLGDPDDVLRLLGAIPTHAQIYNNVQELYEHMDFVWGVNAYQEIYPSIFKLLASVQNDKFQPEIFAKLQESDVKSTDNNQRTAPVAAV